MGRKLCGKRRNCSISPLSTAFSKDSYSRHVKTRACLRKGLNSLTNDKITDWSKFLFKWFEFGPVCTLSVSKERNDLQTTNSRCSIDLNCV